ncbi:ATP-binding cassette domain-containing protein [Ruegeria sp. 1NDH52C]|uniref:ATP-binding cassette domain-containing protein n=1 Tax=Ruegeria alba TaxID=2916756 RepID=A0ABS9P0Y6_9RHOB|nr:ATP-binding cassette domain-containing protein [Ruegeria alba]MCG6560160.1 ATP-binding cassette domain-containing protein [Ruegeria alba]
MASVLLPVSLLLAVLLLIPELFGDFTAYQIGLYLIYGIAAQGIGFLWGKTGVLPLGQALFFGVAAYITAITLRAEGGLVLDLALAAGVLVIMAVFAFALAALIFRGRNESGPYFSLITLALVMIAEQIAGTATNLTGGFNGMSGFQSLGNLDPFGGFYYVIVTATVAVSLLLFILNRLPVNLIARAVANNEPRLQLLGFPTHAVKGAVFAFSAVIAALAGGLFASHQGIVTPTSTGFALSAEMVILAAVGGRFHVLGPLIGAVIVGWASAELRDSFPYWELLMAVAFILVVLKAPGGIAELLESAYRRFRPVGTTVPKPAIVAPKPRNGVAKSRLQFDDVKLSIGVVRILNGVSFETPATGIVSVIGPNGAGKTSALNTITGNLRLTSGSISLGDTRIDSRPPHMALGVGIGRKLQVPSVFFSMSVSENLSIAMMANRAGLIDLFRPTTFQWRSKPLADLLEHPSVPLQEELVQPVEHLPQGHRQFLEYAMTIAAEPPVLLLDEPCAGLSPDETGLMTDLVRDYQADTGGLVIVIEHDMSIVEAISDKVLVLHLGQVLAFDTFDKVRSNPDVQVVYAGGTK